MTDAAASEAESIDSIAAAGVPDARQAAGFVHDLTQRGPIHTTDVDGCRIVWRRFGAGPHVLLVHGGHGSWLHWARNIDALAARHTVWVPDLPGFGASGDPADGEMSTLVATLAAGFAQLPVDGPVDLVGFSFGGLTASYLASALPNVRSVALLGPGGHGGVRRQTINLVDWRRADDAAALGEAMRHNVAAFMIADPDKIDALALLAYTESCRHTRFRSKQISRAGGLAAALDRFQAPSQRPVVIAYGEHDVTADPAAVLAALADGRPHRQGVIIDGAGHWVQYEAHNAVNALLLDWLARQPG
ncbi:MULTISPECIES: alpha/beta fold hydrolase [unclassified Cupriavidus]|uniref:alpha/beta fold hydrolase n=1 Tax=unclassified Cupriavidus TaxID=2640874 RepID=UPI001C006B28|nr:MULTISPECIES: alpha/beta fold hydrolase [unclassified Cupriavidus]MCA3187476.1 alpha/beta fold hydrolase [Cupriavidus sp.]MCA3188492.1 alpha/beta fold hydrolase [Cupriavidus sp.]MCA3199482.1 alpha/beta fold hydrolase [Cupriavidus sp.]MCA3204499.1 alpha/beta fold hydrolase [Cupriavidus sp.]MCA3206011.1 alpha/beta fold hydrolase [Cupriavidus sp.]